MAARRQRRLRPRRRLPHRHREVAASRRHTAGPFASKPQAGTHRVIPVGHGNSIRPADQRSRNIPRRALRAPLCDRPTRSAAGRDLLGYRSRGACPAPRACCASSADQTPKLRRGDKLLLSAMSRMLARERWAAFILTPATLVRWHRELVRRKWTDKRRRARGRPPFDPETRALIVRMARENPRWGCVRIRASSRA
jgi:hypothetical protein